MKTDLFQICWVSNLHISASYCTALCFMIWNSSIEFHILQFSFVHSDKPILTSIPDVRLRSHHLLSKIWRSFLYSCSCLSDIFSASLYISSLLPILLKFFGISIFWRDLSLPVFPFLHWHRGKLASRVWTRVQRYPAFSPFIAVCNLPAQPLLHYFLGMVTPVHRHESSIFCHSLVLSENFLNYFLNFYCISRDLI